VGIFHQTMLYSPDITLLFKNFDVIGVDYHASAIKLAKKTKPNKAEYQIWVCKK